MGSLDSKVAIVTGAGRGIGRGEALLLAAHGATVVVNDMGTARDGAGDDTPVAREVVDEITAAGGRAVVDTSDVSEWSSAEAIVARAVEEFGRLDILVNNAGILRDAMSFNMDEADWDDVIRVHLKGHFAMARFAALHWRARSKAGEDTNGRIINTASESGLYGMVGQANYSAAKGGIASLTLTLAQELARYGVTVNTVAPRARTRLTATVGGADDFMAAPPSGFDEWDPDNVAPVVVFLAGEGAAGITGRTFVVWGEHVYAMQPWTPVNDVAAGGQRWSVDDLVDARDRLLEHLD